MKFYIDRLGCPKNDVDGDYIAARLVAEGHTPVSTPEDADTVLVNTCGFIQAAKEESIEAILDHTARKQRGHLQQVLATGCLSQRYGRELLEEIPELDGAFGHGALDSIAHTVTTGERPKEVVKREARSLGYLTWKDRFISDAYPWSYLKISDGCDRTCTYCAIPGMRGRFRSRPLDSIIREAEFLAANGKRELILVSQEATLWGYELPGKPSVITLLEALDRVSGIEWIRLMYQYPAALSDDLIDYMASGSRTLPYFDLPMQHASTTVLDRMNRRVEQGDLTRLIERIRTASPNATLRTTFIVGFPGESDREFDELMSFTAEHEFDRMGVFTYSAEEGTSAATMSSQIPAEIARQRADQLESLQADIAHHKATDLIGDNVMVMIDSVSGDGRAIGRTAADCPEIDQEVKLRGENSSVGDLVTVRITDVDALDLVGDVASERVA